MDNYPDDIRMYDHDPRSPFYKEPDWECPACGQMNKADADHCHNDCEVTIGPDGNMVIVEAEDGSDS